ncbi:MAG: TIGR01906 family membrane protein [Erysipelotrichaceae bacterium]|nr:TIGR01906 family membrane protein [Erysipelotrichaceae bacterium]
MQKTRSEKTLFTLVSALFVLFAILFSVHFWSFNEKFYRSEHSKIQLYGKSIADHIGISEEDLDTLTHFTLTYLNDPKANLEIQMNVKGEMREIFTDDEKLHMIDVKKLNLTANCLMVISGIISFVGIAYAFIKKKTDLLFLSYKKVLMYVAIVIGVLGIWILIDFDSFWTSFHHVFFPSNDLWLLDLRKDILIMIVPPEFFNHLVVTIVITFIAIIAVSYFGLYSLYKRGVQ